jgi:CRISPR-associated protein Cas1
MRAGKEFENMLYWQDSVKSGDPDNYEARAAAYYWKNIFSEFVQNFVRGRFETSPNNLLNYGYAILRAVTARSLVASGLLPTLGIHHHNKYNAYALADDIMEPYRPFVDEIVYGIVRNSSANEIELNTKLKAELLQIPAIDVIIDGEKSPLMIAMQRTTASLHNCFAGTSRKILYPVL